MNSIAVKQQKSNIDALPLAADLRRRHNLDLTLRLAEFFAVHPCENKSPLAKRHTELDTAIDRAAVIKELKAQHERAHEKLVESKREPFRMPFQIGSSKNPDTIQRWADERPDFVPGLSGGAGNSLYIVDCDKPKKEGDVDGVEFFHSLAERNGFDLLAVPATLTQSGGRHYFFKNPHLLGCGARGFTGKNIQIRAEGGYVIAPGSIREDGRAYVAINGHPDLLEAASFQELLDAPQWLINAAGSTAIETREYRGAPANYDPEDPAIIDRLLFELGRRYPETLSTGDRHQTLMSAAHSAFDFGLTEDEAVEFITPWFNDRCEEPLSESEIENTIRRMRNCREDAIGRDYIANWKTAGFFGAVDDPDEADWNPPSERPRKSKLLSAADIAEEPLGSLATPLVDELLSFGDTGCFYGPPGCGKTFLLLDMALHIASGKPWAGFDVTQAAVLYVGAENPVSIRRRVKGWLNYHKADAGLPFYLLSESLMLDTRQGRAALIARAKEVQSATPCPIGLIVVDTLAKSMGGNENEAQHMSAIIGTAIEVASVTGAALLYVHHQPKSGDGPRGSTALPGGVDALVSVQKGLAKATKLKDEEFLPSIAFSVASVPLGTKQNGKPLKTGVAICRPASREASIEPDAKPERKRPSPCGEFCLQAAIELQTLNRGIGPSLDQDDDSAEPMRTELDWSAVYVLASEHRVRAQGKPLHKNSSKPMLTELTDRGWLIDLGNGKVAVA